MSTPFAEMRLPRSIAAASLLAATVALGCGATAAVAADMPMKAAETLPYQWAGCHAGFNLGAGMSGTNFGSTVDPGTYLGAVDAAAVSGFGAGGGGANDDGILAGGQAGCDWQSSTLVYGLETDFDVFHSNPNFNNNTNTLPTTGAPFSIAQSLTTNFLATVRPRIGIAADRNLAYVTGGAAFTSVNYAETYSDSNGAPGPGAGTASASRTLVGWTAGAGWEYALADHWTVKAEYLFVSFPTTSALGTIVAPGGTNTLHGSSDLVIQLVRAGVNFKF
jgi:outer membrane immunogenic protein